jgi:hypothetical protein
LPSRLLAHRRRARSSEEHPEEQRTSKALRFKTANFFSEVPQSAYAERNNVEERPFMAALRNTKECRPLGPGIGRGYSPEFIEFLDAL